MFEKGGFFFNLAQNMHAMNEIVHPKGKLYYSMGEVCELFGVKPSLIRFWEEHFSVLKPHRNNKGNRLFTPADVDNIGLIYNLVKERGMTLAGAEKKIKEDRKGKNKLNHNVEIIQRLQKIRNLLREVKEDIDNDENVVARFDEDDAVENEVVTVVEPIVESVAEEKPQAESVAPQEAEQPSVEDVATEEKREKKRGRPKKESATEEKEKPAKRGRKKKPKYEEQYLDLFSMIDFEQVSVAEEEMEQVEVSAESEQMPQSEPAPESVPESIPEVAPVVVKNVEASHEHKEAVAEESVQTEGVESEQTTEEEVVTGDVDEDGIAVVESKTVDEGETIVIPEVSEPEEKKQEEVKQIFF